ncbi:MAG: hypothetical protein AAFY39_13755 [Pseudomonadota bacterium]
MPALPLEDRRSGQPLKVVLTPAGRAAPLRRSKLKPVEDVDG